MARFSVAATKDATGGFQTANVTDPLNGSTIATTKAAVAADVATLVADGATPTQAHVNTLNTDWTALAADIAGVYPLRTDVVLSVDLANVTTLSQLRRALNNLLVQAEGSGRFTP